MLDAYIIEQIRQREAERHRLYERPALELPLLEDDRYQHPPREEEPEAPRVIIIDL